ncbi:hypothetical protein LEP1GSC133_2502 [Leptospira borgpetersenii serovar Pomona str. 200901868]|uniref:Uncharacterized protein n=1 Tax=Leptospira borgpetersenii serovar Pomona str. 200901868 TaxID=1192866 RepID=M6W3D9_LEPBO|nr:hypothetical protein LEP1GSC133_2502 [Leptospira borgpetersenii serovar Pomona str. 200901868]
MGDLKNMRKKIYCSGWGAISEPPTRRIFYAAKDRIGEKKPRLKKENRKLNPFRGHKISLEFFRFKNRINQIDKTKSAYAKGQNCLRIHNISFPECVRFNTGLNVRIFGFFMLVVNHGLVSQSRTLGLKSGKQN